MEAEQTVVEVPATIRVSESDYNRVLMTKQDLSKVASFLVEQYSKGGVLLKATQANYLSTISGRNVKTAEDVLTIVESGINRHSANGNLVVSYALDPAFAEPMEELARQQGRTVEEILQEAMAVVFTNSWLYSLETSGGTLVFTRETREELEAIIGCRSMTGAILVEALKKLLAKNVEKPVEEPKPDRVSSVLKEVKKRLDQKEQKVQVA